MNYTALMNELQNASLFDLYRLSVAIRHELENPARIEKLRQYFKEGDSVSYFDQSTNAPQNAIVLQKNLKYVVVKNITDQKHWKIPYYLLNLSNVDINIYPNHQQKLSKNNLRVMDCVGFNHDGQEIFGIVIRLNQKTVSLITKDQHRWRVSYGVLFKVIDADIIKQFNGVQIAHWIKTEETKNKIS